MAKAFQPLTITFKQASELSSLSVGTLRRHAREGNLRTVLVGGRRLVVSESLRQLLFGSETQSETTA
jgi:predicted site-specific integrase-resolvase